MIRFPRRGSQVPAEVLARLVWVSTALALIFTLPPLAIFLGIYYGTGEVLAGALAGFGVHFAILAFAGRISRLLTGIMS